MKCKKGYKEMNGMCVPTEKTIKKSAKKIPRIVYIALIGALVSVGGWALFSSILKLTNLENLNAWWMGLIGLGIITLTTFLGWRRIK